MTTAPLLRVDNLRVAYGGVEALRDVSLDVAAGEIVAVLGNNGAGKSTLLRAVSGTLPLQRGAITGGGVRVDGRSVAGLDPADIVHAGVVQVPEARRIFGSMTVEENLRAGAFGRKGMRRAERAVATDEVYELFPRLAERRAQRAGLMSGGEQQMLAIGRALMAAPKLLLLDEPSLGLAPKIVDQIGEIVREINRGGTAVVLVEQNAAMALQVADRAYVLEVGGIALEGDAAQLSASDEVRERYVGISTTTTTATADAPEPEPVLAPPVERFTSAGRTPEPLVVEDVCVRFGGLLALDAVSLVVRPGTTHAVIGPNGAGKSTLLNVLTGVYRATSGTVGYGGAVVTGRTSSQIAALGVSRTFQNLALSTTATVRENLLLGRHRHTTAGIFATGLRLPSARRELAQQLEIVDGIAELVGLAGKEGTTLAQLSYGDRKRVELARALCAEPDLLLLDEPVAGMNHAESQEMARVIAQVRGTLGISIVLVEHDMPFVMGLADEVTVLDFGKVIASGPPADIQRHPEVLRAYLGYAEGNHEMEVQV